jgi:hypothetical protein
MPPWAGYGFFYAVEVLGRGIFLRRVTAYVRNDADSFVAASYLERIDLSMTSRSSSLRSSLSSQNIIPPR